MGVFFYPTIVFLNVTYKVEFMGSRSPGFFRLNFYKDLNAFEIYKCLNGEGNDGVPDCHELIYDSVIKEWEFVWGDTLIINWTSADNRNDESGDHHLFFERDVPNSDARKSPLSVDAKDARVNLISNGQKIQFVHDKHDEAKWSFDFCWTNAQGKKTCIDPTGKVKNPS